MSLEKLRVVVVLAWTEYKRLYGNVFLGLAWPVARALIFISTVYLIVFSGIRGSALNELSFTDFVWLLAGYCCWYVLAEAGSKSIGSVAASKAAIYNYGLDVLDVALRQFLLALPTTVLLFAIVFVAILVEHADALLALLALVGLLGGLCIGLITSIWVTYMTLTQNSAKEFFPLFFQFGFWLTPILWEPTARLSALATYNPIYQPMHLLRELLGGAPDAFLVFLPYLVGLLGLTFLSASYVKYRSRYFADNL